MVCSVCKSSHIFAKLFQNKKIVFPHGQWMTSRLLGSFPTPGRPKKFATVVVRMPGTRKNQAARNKSKTQLCRRLRDISTPSLSYFTLSLSPSLYGFAAPHKPSLKPWLDSAAGFRRRSILSLRLSRRSGKRSSASPSSTHSFVKVIALLSGSRPILD